MIFGTPNSFAHDTFAGNPVRYLIKYWNEVCKATDTWIDAGIASDDYFYPSIAVDDWSVIPPDDADIKRC
jgi:disulfide oxidoreductase YuzD